MRKLLCVLISFSILIFSSFPVYASEVVVDESYFNFDNLGVYNLTAESFLDKSYSYINEKINVSGVKIYLFPAIKTANYYGYFLVSTTSEIILNDLGTANSYYSNYTSTEISLADSSSTSIAGIDGYYRPGLAWFNKDYSLSIPSSVYYIDHTEFPDDDFLLFENGKCVSESFCASEYYYDSELNTDDGNGGKDYTGVLSRVINWLKSIVNAIVELPSQIIGIPPDGYFSEKITEIKNMINEKYNLDSLFAFFDDMQNIQSVAPNLTYNKNLTFNNTSIPFNLAVDFSWFDGEIKNGLFNLIRMVGYPMLIIYNLNQFYLLFRGRKFFDDGGDDE